MSAVPGYPRLRFIGGALNPAEQHISSLLLSDLEAVASKLGVLIDIFSGSGGPSVRGAGFAGDPHEKGVAVDASIRGQPIGNYPGAVDALHALGLRSGATDFTYQGKPDPAHVDTLSTSNTGGGAAQGITTLDQFVSAVLKDLGVPDTIGNRTFLSAIAFVEGTKARNNPLATTLRTSNSRGLSGNPDGVQEYPTGAEGAQATADTLKNYSGIVTGLRSNSILQLLFSGNAQVRKDLATWSGNSNNPAGGNTYFLAVVRAAQGNSKGKTAGDIGSFDLGNAAGAAGSAAGAVGNAAGAVAGAITAVPDFLAKITDPHNLLRAGEVVAGAVLIMVGVYLLARQVGLAPSAPAPVRAAAGAVA